MPTRSMAPSKRTMLFVCLLVAAVAVVPIAQGQTSGGLFGLLSSVIRIEGTVFCTVNGNAIVGTVLTPVFPNATVQLLRCGEGNGTVIGAVKTNPQGLFSLLLNGDFFTLGQLLSGCRVVVATPLASCNATLPSSGILTATLTSVGTTLSALLTFFNINVTPFISSII